MKKITACRNGECISSAIAGETENAVIATRRRFAAAGCLRPHFGWSLRLGSSPTFALGHPKLLSLGATSRRHHLNPAEAHRRWRGERSEAIRLAVRDHQTRSLGAQSPAQSEQWCCCFGRRRIISGSAENRGSSRPSAIDRPPAQASLLRSYIRPELRFPHAAAQTRIVSVARIRLDSRKSVRPFKGIFCDD